MSENYPKFYLYKRIVQAKLFMDDHFSEKIDLGNIADEAYFSKFHFIRLFKTIYGMTPHQYLVNVRMERSKDLLQSGITVISVCTLVGFESVSSFTALFKRYTKITPLQYQQLFILRQQQIKKTPLKFIPNCFADQQGWTNK